MSIRWSTASCLSVRFLYLPAGNKSKGSKSIYSPNFGHVHFSVILECLRPFRLLGGNGYSPSSASSTSSACALFSNICRRFVTLTAWDLNSSWVKRKSSSFGPLYLILNSYGSNTGFQSGNVSASKPSNKSCSASMSAYMGHLLASLSLKSSRETILDQYKFE